jgi:hypothetical protein
MGPAEDTNLLANYVGIGIDFKPADIITVNGSSGSTLFSIKPNGEFVPGPGLEESAIGEFTKTFYKTMTVFGKSFAETLEEKEMRIKELEKEIEEMKNLNGTQNKA